MATYTELRFGEYQRPAERWTTLKTKRAEKRPLGRQEISWEGNINMDLTELDCKDGRQVEQVQKEMVEKLDGMMEGNQKDNEI